VPFVPSRQEELLDAAIAVLGGQGVRQLTHRAVDVAAGLPSGSTSNYFKTRDALLVGIVDRFVARERAGWAGGSRADRDHRLPGGCLEGSAESLPERRRRPVHLDAEPPSDVGRGNGRQWVRAVPDEQ